MSSPEAFLNSQGPKLHHQHGMEPRDLRQGLPVLQTTAPPQPWLGSENVDVLHCAYVCYAYVCLHHTLPMLPEAPWHRCGVVCLFCFEIGYSCVALVGLLAQICGFFMLQTALVSLHRVFCSCRTQWFNFEKQRLFYIPLLSFFNVKAPN